MRCAMLNTVILFVLALFLEVISWETFLVCWKVGKTLIHVQPGQSLRYFPLVFRTGRIECDGLYETPGA